MFKKKEKPIKGKKVRTMKVGTHKKSVIALWAVSYTHLGVGRHEATSNIRKKDLSRLYNENSTSIQ